MKRILRCAQDDKRRTQADIFPRYGAALPREPRGLRHNHEPRHKNRAAANG